MDPPDPQDPPTSAPDPAMARIAEGIAACQQGDRAGARATFTEAWEGIGGDSGPALLRCALAHSMADAQDDVADELAWDLRALAAAEQVTDAEVAAAGMPGSAESLRPSLHLNLADAYRRLGDVAPARRHVAAGMATVSALPAGGYGDMIRSALERLGEELGPG